MTERSADSLRLTVDVPDRVRTGTRVPILLRVENVSDGPLELYLRGREPTAEIVVRDARGGTVWRNLEGVAVPAILLLRPLAVGESFNIREEWDLRTRAGASVPPGRVTIEAHLLGESGRGVAFPARSLEILP